jgi:hypothetical protein
MYILFIDESGTPPKAGKSDSRYFVVGGVIIPEGTWHNLRDAVFGLKIRRKIRGEFKWRYFAPGNTDDANPMRHLGQGDRDSIRAELYSIICSAPSVRTIASVCSATAAYKLGSVSTQDDIYHLTYKTISERFQYHLQDTSRLNGRKEYGIIVGDHRGSKDDARLRRYHQMLLHSGSKITSTYINLILLRQKFISSG